MKMKKIFLIAVFIAFTGISALFGQDIIPGELIVQFQAGKNPKSVISEVNSGLGFEALHLGSCLSASWNTWLLTYPLQAGSAQDILSKLRTEPGVKLAQFNHTTELRTLEPDDPQFSAGAMWSLKNTGQNNGTADADIDAPEAWLLSTGGLTTLGDTIVVAVIDGGFSLSHQDLNFWKNYGEIAGDGIDNDGNGYVDDRNGWNASANSGSITSNSHGTHVAGTVGAKGNNALGVTGVSWNVKVMAVQGSSGNEATVVAAYSYVADQRRLYNNSNGTSGAFVVATNSSFGVNNGNPANYPIWCAMYDSMGVLGILSAGATANLNIDIDAQGDIPTACSSSWLISVTNTTRNDQKNSGAAYGLTTIDLGAPGTSVMSTLPSNSYGNQTGTSMATPHVAGAIGLMFSYACPQMLEDYRLRPDSIALVIRDMLLNGTDSIPALQNITVTGGRLNLHKALLEMDEYECVLTSSVKRKLNDLGESSLYYIAPNPAASQIEIGFFLAMDETANLEIFDLSGRLVSTEILNAGAGYHSRLLQVSSLESGNYFLRIRQGGKITRTQKFVKLP